MREAFRISTFADRAAELGFRMVKPQEIAFEETKQIHIVAERFLVPTFLIPEDADRFLELRCRTVISAERFFPADLRILNEEGREGRIAEPAFLTINKQESGFEAVFFI